MKKLPIEITPNPLISSVVEVRFLSELKTEDIIKNIFPIIGDIFPNVINTDLPRIMKNDPKLKYTPDFIFSNNEYSISIGTNIIIFENIDTYHLWDKYFVLIKQILEKIEKLHFINKIERIGVRYISLFEPKFKITEIMNLKFLIPSIDYKQTNSFLQTELLKENMKLVLRIAENGNVTKGIKTYRGLFVDIDASQEYDLPNSLNKNLLNIIDKLHYEEKLLFYFLLTETFLATLNPKY
ncbi:MAG: TIGR04255 family protein [Ignavibacteria bacterium]|nr:TIGR04255 family protein [Ignavibacteria bacterium]